MCSLWNWQFICNQEVPGDHKGMEHEHLLYTSLSPPQPCHYVRKHNFRKVPCVLPFIEEKLRLGTLSNCPVSWWMAWNQNRLSSFLSFRGSKKQGLHKIWKVFKKTEHKCRQNGVAEMMGGREDMFHKTLQLQLTKFMTTRHLNSYISAPTPSVYRSWLW